MKALVVYESLWGNTEQVARAVADVLAGSWEVEVAQVGSRPTVSDDVDLVVAGGPTHAFSMTRPSTRADAVKQGATRPPGPVGLREWLAGLPHDRHRTVVATFDTRVGKVRHLPGSASKSAAREARRHGYRPASPPQSFYVEDAPGPLLEGELDRAREWGRELASLVG